MSRTILALLACGALMGVIVPEAMAFGGPGGGPWRPAFSDLDANGDGAVSQAEFEAHAQQRAREHFARMDTNGDGVVTEEEMEAARPPRPRRGPGGGPGGPGPGGPAPY